MSKSLFHICPDEDGDDQGCDGGVAIMTSRRDRRTTVMALSFKLQKNQDIFG